MTTDAPQTSSPTSRPNCVVRSTSGWFEEDEPTNPKNATATPSSLDVVRMDMIDDYEKELEHEFVQRIGQLMSTDISETDRKDILAAARSRDLYKKHVHRANEEQQKLRSDNKKIMRGNKTAHSSRAEHEQRGSYTGSLEEQHRAGCKIISKKHTIDLEEDAGLEEAKLMALVRMKQLGRQSWQDLDEVCSSESPSSKLHSLEHGIQSPKMLKPVKGITCP